LTEERPKGGPIGRTNKFREFPFVNEGVGIHEEREYKNRENGSGRYKGGQTEGVFARG